MVVGPSAESRWKSDVFAVNATQPGPARNATAAVHAAIAAAEANHGGVVYFPRGQYFVTGPLLVPNGVVLRGEATDLVSIYFGEDNEKTAPQAYISGSGPSPQQWGMEGLTLYVTAFANNIVQFQPGTNGGFMRKCRIRFNSYFCLEPQEGGGSRGRTTTWLHSVGTAVKLAGTNLFVTDNDIYSTGDVVSTLSNGAAGGTYMHIARNRFWNGGTTHWGISWKQCIYEDNVATGASTTAMGSNYPQYAHTDGAPHVQNIYHHNNSQTMVWGNDREMMTCDGGGGVYFGHATSAGDIVTLASPAAGPQPGGGVCVLQGTGTGECRRAIGNVPSKPGVITAGAALGLTPCGGGGGSRKGTVGAPAAGAGAAVPSSTMAVEWQFESLDGAGLIQPAGETNLSIATCCDSTCGNGCGSCSDKCGAETFAEPLVLAKNDSWALQYGTDVFEFVAAADAAMATGSSAADGSSIQPAGLTDAEWELLTKFREEQRRNAKKGDGDAMAVAALATTGQIKLKKSGKCVGTVAGSHTVQLVACSQQEATTTWKFTPSSSSAAAAAAAGSSAGSSGRLELVGGGGKIAELQSDSWCLGVAGGKSGDMSEWQVDQPFTVDLDDSSQVTIVPYIGNIAFNGNNYSDGGEVQFYAQAFGVVAAENRFERTGGLSAWARGYSGKDANLRNSFIDNTVVEGNHVWNYNTLPTPATKPDSYPYYPGGSKTVEPWFFASLTNEQGQ